MKTFKLVCTHTESFDSITLEFNTLDDVKKEITNQMFNTGPFVSYALNGKDINGEEYIDQEHMNKLEDEYSKTQEFIEMKALLSIDK